MSVILAPGALASDGYRSYLDAQHEAALSIARIDLGEANADSSDEDKPPDVAANIRKGFLFIPAEFPNIQRGIQ